MKDLVFECDKENGERIILEYDTIMSFTDSIETNSYKNYQNVDAIFFDNPLLRKRFDSIEHLYHHCKAIIR